MVAGTQPASARIATVAAVPPELYAHRLGRAYGPDSSAAALTRALERAPPGATLQARDQGTRRPSPRTPHHPRPLRAAARPPGAGADRGDQLLVRCIRAGRRARLSGSTGRHRRPPHTRARSLGRRVGLHGVCVEHVLLSRALVATLRAFGLSVTNRDTQPRRPARSAPAVWPRRRHKRLPPS